MPPETRRWHRRDFENWTSSQEQTEDHRRRRSGVCSDSAGCRIAQAIAVGAAIVYSGAVSFVLLKVIGFVLPLRATTDGNQKGQNGDYRGREYNVTLLPKMEIETVIEDDAADDAIKAIATAARTGEIGDGRIFVLPVIRSYKIRTGEMTT